MIPSEKYILIQRLILFADEWLFYSVLIMLWLMSAPLLLFLAVVSFGAFGVSLSYKRQWAMEASRFQKVVTDDKGSMDTKS